MVFITQAVPELQYIYISFNYVILIYNALKAARI